MTKHFPLTREDLDRVVGEIDDLLAAEIIATGASLEELIEAVTGIERQSQEGETSAEPSTRRVAKLRDLLDGPLARDRWAGEDEYRD